MTLNLSTQSHTRYEIPAFNLFSFLERYEQSSFVMFNQLGIIVIVAEMIKHFFKHFIVVEDLHPLDLRPGQANMIGQH